MTCASMHAALGAAAPAAAASRRARRAVASRCSCSAAAAARAAPRRVPRVVHAGARDARADASADAPSAAGSDALLARRQLFAAAPALLLAAAAWPALAEEASFAEYTIDAPKGWTRAEGTASGAVGTRQVTVFHVADDLETNVNIITTLASVELTKLSSLGSAYEFGFTLVNSQDRRGRKTDKQIANLLGTEDVDGTYRVEYTIQRPDAGVDRHLYSLVTMRFDGTYNKLYTVTGQFRAADKDKFDAIVKQCVASFRLKPVGA